MRFAIFPLHVSKILRLPRKSDARSYEVLHLSHRIIFPNLKIWCSKMQQEISARTSYITSLMNMSLVLCLPLKMHLCISSSSVPRLPLFLKLLQILTFCSRLTRCKKTLRQPRKTLLFSSLTLPTSAFPSVHIAGSLTSKLSSNMTMATSLDNCGCIPRETAPPSLREVFLAKLIGACCDQIYDLEIWRFLKMLDPQATMGFSNCHPWLGDLGYPHDLRILGNWSNVDLAAPLRKHNRLFEVPFPQLLFQRHAPIERECAWEILLGGEGTRPPGEQT